MFCKAKENMNGFMAILCVKKQSNDNFVLIYDLSVLGPTFDL